MFWKCEKLSYAAFYFYFYLCIAQINVWPFSKFQIFIYLLITFEISLRLKITYRYIKCQYRTRQQVLVKMDMVNQLLGMFWKREKLFFIRQFILMGFFFWISNCTFITYRFFKKQLLLLFMYIAEVKVCSFLKFEIFIYLLIKFIIFLRMKKRKISCRCSTGHVSKFYNIYYYIYIYYIYI